MKKIYVLGNPILEEDNLALKITEILKKELKCYEFIQYDPAEPLPKNPIFLDVSPDVNDVSIIENIDRLQGFKAYSLHDFDLAMLLKIMKEIGKVKNIKLIVIPSKVKSSKIKDVVDKVKKILCEE